MKFLNPCLDWAFKRIFGSAESRRVLIAFLNDLLHSGRPVIVEVDILDPYLPSRIRQLKNTAVDVRARLSDGQEVLVEMQMWPVAGYAQRVLYNGAKCLAAQLGRGHDYRRIRPVTVVTLADCRLLPGPRWRHDFRLADTKSRQPYPGGDLHLVFVELPKVVLADLPAAEPLRDWLAFLKNAPGWDTVPRLLQNPGVREALTLARHDSLTPSESETMSRKQLYQQDLKNGLLYAREEGLQKGFQKAAESIARRLLAKGMEPQAVADGTGLTLSKVKALAKKTAA